ncbi:MAG TPA: acyl dehydratase [Pseudolabrys sp.]|nr:acyl dehydratase [Pseudolabrys sp.]
MIMAGAQQIFFDDVILGTEIPALVKGPLSAPILMRWSAAIENWHRIHYDRDFAVNHDKLPDLAINGTLKQQLVAQALRRWAGPAGWLWKVSFQFRALNKVGETLRIWARVVGKRELPDYGLVDLELGIVNDAGAESTPGTAVVALPYRHRGAGVPYPFVPPDSK